MNTRKARIGIDLGGTKIEAVVMGENNDIMLRRRVDTPSDSYEAVLDAIRDLIHDVEQSAHLPAGLAVGFGTPGTVS